MILWYTINSLDRDWIVDVADIDSVWVILFAALPAAFYTILLVMDRRIQAVIVNRKDNKLKVSEREHLFNLIYLIFFFYFIKFILKFI